MSESITNFGTPRSIYSLANGDIDMDIGGQENGGNNSGNNGQNQGNN